MVQSVKPPTTAHSVMTFDEGRVLPVSKISVPMPKVAPPRSSVSLPVAPRGPKSDRK